MPRRTEQEECGIGYVGDPYANSILTVRLYMGGAWVAEFLSTHYSSAPKAKQLVDMGYIFKLGINIGPQDQFGPARNPETDCEFRRRDQGRNNSYDAKELTYKEFLTDYNLSYRYLYDATCEQWYAQAGTYLLLPVPTVLRVPKYFYQNIMTVFKSEENNEEDDE